MAQFPSAVATDSNLYVAVNSLATSLVGALTSSGGNYSPTEIQVFDTTGFPTSGGFITIDTEAISYTGISSSPARFTGISRGADGTIASAHNNGVATKLNVIAAHHNVLKEEVKAIEQNLSDRIGLSTTQVIHPVGSASAPSITFAGDLNTGIYAVSADYLGFSVGGTARVALSTTSLDIATGVRILNSTGTALLPSYSFDGDPDTGIYNIAANSIGFAVNGLAQWRISNIGEWIPLQTTGTIFINNGTEAAPLFAFNTDTNTGVYSFGADSFAISCGGTRRWSVDPANGMVSTLKAYFPLGAAATPSISFVGDENTGFYRYSADTIGFVTNGVDRAYIDSASFTSFVPIVSSTQHSFNVTLSATVNDVTGDGTVYTVAFNTEAFDVGSNFNTGTYTFTAPLTGKYLLSTQIRTQGASANGLASDVVIVTSNRSYYSSWPTGTTAGTGTMHDLTVVADMDAGDTAYVTVNVAGGTKTVDLNNGYARFSGYFLG